MPVKIVRTIMGSANGTAEALAIDKFLLGLVQWA